MTAPARVPYASPVIMSNYQSTTETVQGSNRIPAGTEWETCSVTLPMPSGTLTIASDRVTAEQNRLRERVYNSPYLVRTFPRPLTKNPGPDDLRKYANKPLKLGDVIKPCDTTANLCREARCDECPESATGAWHGYGHKHDNRPLATFRIATRHLCADCALKGWNQ